MANDECGDDVFDEEADPRSLSENEWNKISGACVKEGLRVGISTGKEKALQEGFDRGFQEGFQLVKDISVWRGFLKGVSSSVANSSPLTELCERLASLERDIMKGKKPVVNASELKCQVTDVLNSMELHHLVAAINEL
ncbi:protein YAE1 homolog [Ornithodoros turicata]